MTIRSINLSKFNAIITINSSSVNPQVADVSSDESAYQAKLDDDKRASQVLGMDFLMFAEGGLFSQNSDLKKAVGIFNFAQAITHRLSTYRGTMPGDATFGIPWNNYLGQTYKNRGLVTANLRQDILEEVQRDRRTGKVLNLDVRFLNLNAVTVNLTIVPIFTSFDEQINLLITSGV